MMTVTRIVALFIALITLLGSCSLVSCGKKSDEELMEGISEEAAASNMTLSMYLMSEEAVDPITEREVEDAVNTITQKKFSTKLDLHYFTESSYEYFSYTENNVEKVLYMNADGKVNDAGNGAMITSKNFDLSKIDLTGFSQYTRVKKLGYYEALDKAFADRDIAKKNGTIAADIKAAEGTTETVLDEYGIPVPKYPSLPSYQVDILYLGGKDNFLKYKGDKRLKKLDDEINNSAIISTNIPQLLLSNIKALNKGTYAIPTSKPVGEYTYLMLNKNALETAYLKNGEAPTDFSDFTSLTCERVKDFLAYVNSNTNTLSDEYYSIATNLSTDELLINNIQYWGVDGNGNLSDAFSVLGGYYGRDDNYLDTNTYAKFENLFENATFINDIRTLKEYDINGYYNVEDGKKFAVGYYKCDAEEAEKMVETYGDEYEIITVEIPRLDEADLYDDMMAICENTSSIGRSMDILELINSNEEFRNIFLYGVEDTHYQLESTGVNNRYDEEIKAANKFNTSRYHMDAEKTGNTFIAYPAKGESYTVNEFGIVQNQEAKARLDLGFSTSDYKTLNKKELAEIKALSAEVLADYNAISNMADFETFVEATKQKISESEAVTENLKDESGSLYGSYLDWLISKKIIKK